MTFTLQLPERRNRVRFNVLTLTLGKLTCYHFQFKLYHKRNSFCQQHAAAKTLQTTKR